jgi:hemerythrin
MRKPLQRLDAFMVGDAGLDAEHGQMIDLINDFCSAEFSQPRTPARLALLPQLEAVTRAHTEHENVALSAATANLRARVAKSDLPPRRRATMAAAADQAVNDHVVAHYQMSLRLESITRAANLYRPQGGETPGEQLKAWFLDHARKHDAHLKALLAVNSRKAGRGST